MSTRVIRTGPAHLWAGLSIHALLCMFWFNLDNPRAIAGFAICAPTALYFWYTVFRFRGTFVKGTKAGLIVHETSFRRRYITHDLATVGMEIRLVRPDGTIDIVDTDADLQPKPKDHIDIRITTAAGMIQLPVRRSSGYNIKDSLTRFQEWKTVVVNNGSSQQDR